jgi:ribose 5-phosphate isomerase A
MSTTGPSPEALERVAAEAFALVAPGMRLGLGTGRAAEAFIRRLGEAVRGGMAVRGVPTSERSTELAKSLGIPLATLEELPELDVAFDGADEFTASLDLVKGLGGALLRERVVAHAAARFVVLVTPEKRVERLGTRAPIPVEVVPFAKAVVARAIAALGGTPVLREGGGAAYHTDNGNVILDARFDPIADPIAVERALLAIPGVVDTGLFLGMAHVVIVGTPDSIERLERPTPPNP